MTDSTGADGQSGRRPADSENRPTWTEDTELWSPMDDDDDDETQLTDPPLTNETSDEDFADGVEPSRKEIKRQKRRRRRRRIILIGLAGFVLLLFGTLGAIYAALKIPLPATVTTNQVSVLTYADGKTELAKVGVENRTDVSISTVPKYVQQEVLAAEDRGFYKEPGVSVRGIGRAVINNLRGRDTQGGSTITQQYVKNAYLTQERTFSRKFKELAIAVKLDHKYSKDQILEWYLNTIYFGRGAYGIQAASETYFGKTVDKLSVSEGAVLASSIRSPALYDPQTHTQAAQDRWKFVLDGMVTEDWLSKEDRGKQQYPKVKDRSSGSALNAKGPEGYVVQQVKDELANAGFDEARLNREGLRVQTTLDKTSQDAAVAAVNQVFDGQPGNLRQALVAVDPRSGSVLAYYGGKNGNGFDYAQAYRQPGSSFKPYTLATGLEQTLQATPESVAQQGKTPVTVHATYDGTSPRTFGGVEVHNSENSQCPNCTVLDAMKRSINTVFYQMAGDIGPSNVADLAHRVGIADTRVDKGQRTLQVDGVTDASIGIGRYEVRPIDQATGFATFANGGTMHPSHFVQQVTDAKGNVLYRSKQSGSQVLDAKVANDVTLSLRPIAASSRDPLNNDRPSAAKTGTAQLGETKDNQDAWMVGYTPQISAAVWVGTDRNEPLRDAAGRIVFGAGLPGKTWQAFMNAALANKSADSMADSAQVRSPIPPPASPSESPSQSPSSTPSPTPSPTPSTSEPPSSSTTPSPTPSFPRDRPTRPIPIPSLDPTTTPATTPPSTTEPPGPPGRQ